jgi:hypothetical protein
MSDPDGYEAEMLRRRLFDDEMSEAILTGRSPVPDEFAALVSFAEDARALTRSGVPSPGSELRAMFVDGIFAENGDLLVTAASNVHGPAQQAAGLPKRRSKTMTFFEWIAGVSVGAKAALGVGIAAASVTGAGAAGVLPGPIQDAVSSAVSTVTPFEFPSSANSHADFGKTVANDATGTSDSTPGVDGKSLASTAAQNGLASAGTTPAAGHAPAAVPTGAASTPGAGNAPAPTVPTTVPSPPTIPPHPGGRP